MKDVSFRMPVDVLVPGGLESIPLAQEVDGPRLCLFDYGYHDVPCWLLKTLAANRSITRDIAGREHLSISSQQRVLLVRPQQRVRDALFACLAKACAKLGIIHQPYDFVGKN